MKGQSTAPTPAAGWFRDPCGRHEFRYFDGGAWTQNVSDAGKASVDTDPIVAAAEASAQDIRPVDAPGECLLLTLPGTFGGDNTASKVLYLTNRRLVVDPAMSLSKGLRVGFTSGVFGQAHAEKLAKERHLQEPPVDAARLDTLLATVDGAYQMLYSDMTAVTMKRKSHLGSVKITGKKNTTFAVKHELFDQMAEILTSAMPGRVTVK